MQVTKPLGNAEYLYHYTSLEAFVSIIESGALWATHIRYLNDTSEQRLAWGLIRERMRSLRGMSDETRNENIEFYCKTLESPPHEDFFIASFSCDGGDRLSQWRGYKADIAIGFDPVQLDTVCANFWEGHREVRIRKVNYVESSATPRSNELIDNQRSGHMVTILGEEGFDVAYTRMWSRFATMMKHQGFKEEEEWRVIIYDDAGRLEPSFSVRNGRMVPYIPLPLGGKLDSVVRRLTIGPGPFKDETLAAVRKLLASHHLQIEACATETPYRGW